MNKRELIQRTLAMIAAASAARVVRGQHLDTVTVRLQAQVQHVPVSAVVYDERYSDASTFAFELHRCGAVLFPTQQDTGRLWYEGLQQHVITRGGRIAGLTPYSDLYLLQSVARQARLRLVYECQHDCRSCSEVKHLVRRGDHRELRVALTGSGSSWPVSLAQALTLLGSGVVLTSQQTTVMTTAPRARDNPGVLVSWLLGPK